MTITTYNKLIRDKIPEIIEQSGKKAVVEKLDDGRYLNMLNNKLSEELSEYLDGNNVEELADLVEVIYAILELKGVPLVEFEKIRKEKVEARGAFQKRLLLKEVIED
ncbi:MAG: phosphoribosyl-ATP pyrophosphohydrolase [Bacillota bacterium]|jgi:predicted house-cleaning noncanonical NTP pyrophosphatase (MazG superfamily)|nr:nucleoside triphosphate pyrophosphohydrolase [Clostridia bacterium]